MPGRLALDPFSEILAAFSSREHASIMVFNRIPLLGKAANCKSVLWIDCYRAHVT
jgi:hypothetical protein